MDKLTAGYLTAHLYSLYAELDEAYADSALYYIEGGIETTQYYLSKYGYEYPTYEQWEKIGKPKGES